MALTFRLFATLAWLSNYGVMTLRGGIHLDPIPTLPPPTKPPTLSPTTRPTLAPTASVAPSASKAPSETPSVSTAPSKTPTTFSFYVLGDVPYSDFEACMLPFELRKMDASAAFLIHLGDIRDGKPDPVTGEISDCPESMFQELSMIFETSDLTPFFIPGDNAWLDCANATEAYAYWEEYLFKYNERTDLSWPAFPSTVNRWDVFPTGVSRTSRRSEFFSFLAENVLFVGLSLPGSGRNQDNVWTPRDGLIQDNIQWTKENLDAYADVMEAVVMFGHASSNLNADYFDELASLLIEPEYNETAVLFLEDNHRWNVEENFLGLPNLLQIEQDDTVTPMKVTIDTTATGLLNIFQYDRGCFCSTGHRPTKLITYADSHPCGGVCNEAYMACEGESRCSPEGATCDGP